MLSHTPPGREDSDKLLCFITLLFPGNKFLSKLLSRY